VSPLLILAAVGGLAAVYLLTRTPSLVSTEAATTNAPGGLPFLSGSMPSGGGAVPVDTTRPVTLGPAPATIGDPRYLGPPAQAPAAGYYLTPSGSLGYTGDPTNAGMGPVQHGGGVNDWFLSLY